MSNAEKPIYEEVLPGGGMWSMVVRRGRRLRLETLAPGGNVSALVYRADQPLDRLNVPDTLKALHTAKLHAGHVLMSDMGHALMSIVADSTGWHDPLGGVIDAELVSQKFGQRTYQEARNDWFRNGRDNFLVELAKHGLGEADVVANVNFFSRVVVDDAGHMTLVRPGAPTGAFVELRADLDVLLVLANVPHPLALPGEYPRVSVALSLRPGAPADADDACRHFRPECARALALSERHLL
jgi:urea carboxylase-associated protein 2